MGGEITNNERGHRLFLEGRRGTPVHSTLREDVTAIGRPISTGFCNRENATLRSKMNTGLGRPGVISSLLRHLPSVPFWLSLSITFLFAEWT